MEWVSVILFGLVAATALPIGAGAAMGAPALGLQTVCAIGGFACCVVFIVVGGSTTIAWVAFGLAVAGALLTGIGGSQIADHRSNAVIPGEETVALLAGLTGPLYAAEAAIALLVALGTANVLN